MSVENGDTEPPTEPEVASARLDSWKEIAAYLKRDPRTVRRWEHLEGLPVRRHLHGKRASIYGFASEIEAWLKTRSVASREQLPKNGAPQGAAAPGLRTEQLARRTRPVFLAILPLRNLSGEPAQERFADGLTEEIITEVGQFCPKRLRVIGLTSVLQYKQSPKTIGEIGRDLGPDYVLEGGIRRYGNRVRLTARLIAARDEANIWADSYEIRLPAVFSLQQGLARQVAKTLAAELKVPAARTQHQLVFPKTAAFNAYIEARAYFLPTENEIKKNFEHLYMAIEHDPKFAPSYAELAHMYLIRLFWSFPPVVAHARVRGLASRCLELDSGLARAHTVMAGFYLLGDRNWPRAQTSSRRAIKLNPSDPWARIIRAAYHIVVEEAENAMEELEQARQLGPQSAELGQWLVLLAYCARRYDWAIERGQEMLRLDPFPSATHGVLGACHAQKGNNALAVQHCEAATQPGAAPFMVLARTASTYALVGDRDAAERLVQELVARVEKEYVRYIFLAEASVALENAEQTLDWLEKAYEQRDSLLVFLKADPRFDRLSGHPRFRKLLRRIGLQR